MHDIARIKSVHADFDQLVDAVARQWIELAQQTIEDRGEFHVALSGGSTPRLLFDRLVSERYIHDVDWPNIHVYFGDERCVQPDHADSNFLMASQHLLSHVAIPESQIHRINAESMDHQQCAEQYEQILRRCLPIDNQGIQGFDLIMLGLGPDGHIASLFPGTSILEEHRRWVAPVYVTKFSSWRISITFPVIAQAHNVWLLVAGDNKAEIIREVFDKHPQIPRTLYPVEMIDNKGNITWFIDRSAAHYLQKD